MPFKKPEFRIGDRIVQIGHCIVAVITGIDEAHYYVAWVDPNTSMFTGDSVLWMDSVERDFVLVESGSDDEL